MKRMIVWGSVLVLTHGIAYLIGDYSSMKNVMSVRSSYGRFVGNPQSEWLDNRDMRLLTDFIYIDPNENAWLAPEGSVVNGASIPKVFWSMVGAPFTGQYRNASIVHDVACVQRQSTHEEVHRMFFDACMAGGMREPDAKMLYWAVSRFGPRWHTEMRTRTAVYTTGDPDSEPREYSTNTEVVVVDDVAEPTQADLEWAKQFFEDNDPPIEAIPSLF